MNEILISIVSHGHGRMVNKLLKDLADLNIKDSTVVLTENIPEQISYYNYCDLKIVKNDYPKGYGENHNNAFNKYKNNNFFLVLNPDIRLKQLKIEKLFDNFKVLNAAVCAPRLKDRFGVIENSARKFPTLPSLAKKIIFKKKYKEECLHFEDKKSVDWVSGAFMLFDSNAFKLVRGFDTNYFMYYEDVDICKRLSILNYKIIYDPKIIIEHNAQKSSHKKIKYFYWHFKSMTRYFYTKY